MTDPREHGLYIRPDMRDIAPYEFPPSGAKLHGFVFV